MRVTKYDHALLVIDEADASLVVDPGSFTAQLPDVSRAVAVVITHEHPDHWTPEHLRAIRAAAGDIPIFGPQGVATAAADFDVTVVAPGDTQTAGPFTLRFFGGRHAVIHSSIPVVDNVGVLVNETLYYPGDSYAVPTLENGGRVPVLAAPVGAPWLKIGEAMDFVLEVAPERAFSAHEQTLSPAGLTMGRARLAWCVEQGGGTFAALDPGDSLDA
ncbi:beta-lactamase [Microbacterium mangrovi]|uniref:Beta-lactamase n=1 Tax=Microbacterium mangrovi TaxID=1348253 RepID=A0A0B2A1V9_9MICO|nr:MBL fold metallo-hydrolase [Microbacterium mangrovi]KHK97474.1 beta-lactamase [Microbacterium mangrovi]